MFSNQAAEIPLNAPCKSVAAVAADRLESRFFVGTCSVNEDNQLHVLRYHSDVNVVGLDASLHHPTGPIQQIEACPHTDRTLVITLPENSNQATLWKVPVTIMDLSNDIMVDSETNDSYHDGSFHTQTDSSSFSASTSSLATGGAGGVLEEKLTLTTSNNNNNGSDNNQSKLCHVKWRVPSDDETATPGDVLTLDSHGQLVQWDVAMGLAESMHSVQASSDPCPAIARPQVAWDPHHGHVAAVSWGRSVHFLDLRLKEDAETNAIARAHRYGVTDMDYNPNKPFTLVTSGLDGLIHYWDVRTTRRPLLSARGGHSHYAWSVNYNPFHDQLVLSTGTDAVVNLWRVSTISSAPLLTLEDSNVGGVGGDDAAAPNVRVARHEHGDSVYGAAWSAADAWMYLSVAYDGRVALQHVPSKEKYKILL